MPSKGGRNLREMLLNQLVKDFAVESYSRKSTLEELSHVVVFDKRDQDPERWNLITSAMVDDRGNHLAHTLVKEVDALVMVWVREQDIFQPLVDI